MQAFVLAVLFAGCAGPAKIEDPMQWEPGLPTAEPPAMPTLQGPPTLTPLTPNFPTFSHAPSSGSAATPAYTPTSDAATGTTGPAPSGPEEPPWTPGVVTNITAQWRNATTAEVVSRTTPWAALTLTTTFELHVEADVSLEVWAEVPSGTDRQIASIPPTHLTPGRHALEGAFQPPPDNVTSFVPSLKVNGTTAWYPQGSPPRLLLDMHRGRAEVTSVEWFAAGAPVTSASPGTMVAARVTIASTGGGFVDELYIDVRADVASADDHTTATITRRVTLADGLPQTFDVPFVVEDGANLRGHYVHVDSQGKSYCAGYYEFFAGPGCFVLKLSFQHEGYPPRLAKA